MDDNELEQYLIDLAEKGAGMMDSDERVVQFANDWRVFLETWEHAPATGPDDDKFARDRFIAWYHFLVKKYAH